MKNYNMVLIERLQKHQLYNQAKSTNMNTLLVKKYCHLINNKIIEQAKFTYSPLVKAFEKQKKTIEKQGKKQIVALADLKPKEIKPRETKPNEYGNYFLNKAAKIRESYEPVDFNYLTYNFKDLRIPSLNFSKFKGPMHIFKSIRKGYITLEDIEKEQIEFKNDLGHIRQGDPKDKSPEQKKAINNIKNLYNSREEVIRMFNDYAKNTSKNIYESKQGTGVKIRSPKHMLERLPIALPQIKTGNNSDSLLIEIRQIVYSLYQSKEIAKKVYNNIIK